VILNPVAGSVDDREALEDRLGRAFDGRVRCTGGPGDAGRFAREAAEAGIPLVVAAGGDGAVREVVQGLVDGSEDAGSAPSLAILPLGTGNDLARCLRIPTELEDALEVAVPSRGGGELRDMDLMEVVVDDRSTLAVNAVILGNGGRLGRILDAEMKDRWGPLSYLRSAGEIAFELEPLAVEVRLDGEPPRRREILNLVVANGLYAGGGIPIAPGSDPSDGRLEVATVLPAPLPRLLGLLPTLLRHELPEADIYRQEAASSIAVRSESGPVPLSVDGEVDEARAVEVTIHPHRLRVRVPRAGPQRG
jgi:diacylglycerol kinase (ATP)